MGSSIFLLLPIILLMLASVNWSAPIQDVINDPELTAGYFEGDMILDHRQRNGLRDESYRWPNATVYYRFSDHFDDPHRNHILRGMAIIEQVSCIRFKEAGSNQEYFVNITGMPAGCFSTVGWSGGIQNYNLQIYPLDEGCFRLGTVVHELLHTLGFFHMQSASNRDDYVRIATENIRNGTESNFDKYEVDTVDDYDTEYDYGSVLHYSAFAFTANGQMTIIPLHEKEAANVMGQRRGMSKTDINKLNSMYRCPVQV